MAFLQQEPEQLADFHGLAARLKAVQIKGVASFGTEELSNDAHVPLLQDRAPTAKPCVHGVSF